MKTEIPIFATSLSCHFFSLSCWSWKVVYVVFFLACERKVTATHHYDGVHVLWGAGMDKRENHIRVVDFEILIALWRLWMVYWRILTSLPAFGPLLRKTCLCCPLGRHWHHALEHRLMFRVVCGSWFARAIAGTEHRRMSWAFFAFAWAFCDDTTSIIHTGAAFISCARLCRFLLSHVQTLHSLEGWWAGQDSLREAGVLWAQFDDGMMGFGWPGGGCMSWWDICLSRCV